MSLLSLRAFQSLSNLNDSQLLRLIERNPASLRHDPEKGLQIDNQAVSADMLRESIAAAPITEATPLPLEIEAKVLALLEDHIERVLSSALYQIKTHAKS